MDNQSRYQRPHDIPDPPPLNNRRIIIDMGPQPMKPPAKPDSAAFEDADYQAALEQYAVEYREFLRSQDTFALERAAWLQEHGGPVELDMWATSAGESLERDPARYRAELPEGVTPGRHIGVDRIIHG